MRNKLLAVPMLIAVALCFSAAAEVTITMDRYARLAEMFDQSDEVVDMYGLISNSGAEQVSLTCRLSVDQPNEWYSPGACIGEACFPSDMDFPLDLEPGAQDTLHLTFYPVVEAGKGKYSFRAIGETDADSVRVELIAGASSILVDDDEGQDYETFLEAALPIEEGRFLTWDESLELLSQEDIPLIERIIWITGNSSEDALSMEEADVLSAFFEMGGKALLSGQNILDGEAAAELGTEWLGVEVQSTSVESRHIGGVLGGPFGDIVSFDIAGGTGADNQISPDGLVTVGSGRAVLKYDSNEIAAVGRIHIGGARMLVCGFGLEAVSEPEVLETLLGTLLEWFDSVGAPDLPPIPSDRLIAGLSPNPNFGVLLLNLSVRSGSDVAVWLIDVAGRKVAGLHQGEWFQEKLLLPQVSPGAYFIAVRSGEISEKRPIIVIGE